VGSFARTIALGGLLVSASAASLSAQYIIGTRDSLTARVDSVFRAFDRTDSPGCALGVYRDGRIIYARGYGMANLESGVAIGPRTVFDVGSISKEFTATAILLLAQEGKLNVDDPVRRYVPELPAYADTITIRHLLNHTSGIRDYLTLWGMTGRTFDGTADTLDFLRLITRSTEPNFAIGSHYLYSNSGFALLGQIVYRVSKQPLAAFLRAHVFEPLGMYDSRSLDDHTAIIPNRAVGYAPRGQGFRLAASQFDGTGGAGSVHATVEDFARWDRNWDSASVGGHQLVTALQQRGKLRNDSTINYALGIIVDNYRGLKRVWHNGSWAGYRAMFARFPDQHLSVTTFCNLTTSGPDSLALKVATVYLGARMSPDTLGSWERALATAPSVATPIDQLRSLEGVWRNAENGEARRTRLHGDTLEIGFGVGTRLVALGARRFRQSGGTEVTFDDASAVMRIRAGNATTRWTRVPAATLTPAQMAEYAGDYRSNEIETTWSVTADSGRLLVRIDGRRMGPPYEPTYRDAFANGTQYLDFVRDARGHITGLAVQAGRVRNLRFVRAPHAIR
jgi:CubicO group peptidase (beta-lactamase class C family)